MAFIQDPFDSFVVADDPVLHFVEFGFRQIQIELINSLHIIGMYEIHNMNLSAGELPEGNPVECLSSGVNGNNGVVLDGKRNHDLMHGMDYALEPVFHLLQVEPGLSPLGDIRHCTEYCRTAPAFHDVYLHLDYRLSIHSGHDEFDGIGQSLGEKPLVAVFDYIVAVRRGYKIRKFRID